MTECGLQNIDQMSSLVNLEDLDLSSNIDLDNKQLNNISKFKKLHTLDVSFNKVDLTHIHSITSLTKLSMQQCGLRNIELISSLVNLEELDLSGNIDMDISSNIDMDLSPLQQVRSLTKLTIRYSDLTNIDQITQLINLEVLNLDYNLLLIINSIGSLVNLKELDISYNDNIDIAPLKDLVGLIKLNMKNCNLKQLRALKPLIKLQYLDLFFNQDINITELQYLKNHTYLNLMDCNLVSIYVLRPLVNREVLHISKNNIVYLDANINEMKYLKELSVYQNLVSDFISIKQHSNYNNISENGQKCFYIFDQEDLSEEQLHKANKFRKIECPNIQLKEIQNQHKALKTALNNVKQQVNATISNAWQSQIQFTVNVVRLFQLLNQFGFE
ncbi:leucine-rich_repeat domain-containing protein [Hexamita inflata]|uniref:Leucine-rich repeat domain-containing protein n=1 Tax=Hexamita inflata TaxID=28002 RepID=A0AA86V2V2_9EUKA|nr:leucine-rich repeat domain-containing protein [Hexamita inflata]